MATVPRLLGWPRGGSAGGWRKSWKWWACRRASSDGARRRSCPAASGSGSASPAPGRRPRPPADGRAFRGARPGTRETIQDEFLRLHAQLRKTVVLVTHDIAEAGRLAEEIVLIDGGQVVQRGRSATCCSARPTNGCGRFSAGARQELALEVLAVRHVLQDLPPAPLADNPSVWRRICPWAGAGRPGGQGRRRRGRGRHCRPTRSPPGRCRPVSWTTSRRAAATSETGPERTRRRGNRLMFAVVFFDELANAWERAARTRFWPQTLVFLSLTLRALGLALLAGLPLGVLLTRLRRLAGPVTAVLALVQTVPSLVLLGLLIPVLGIGQAPALFAAVVYSLFPVVLNTYVGITQVSPRRPRRRPRHGHDARPDPVERRGAAGVPRHPGRRPHRRRLRQRA